MAVKKMCPRCRTVIAYGQKLCVTCTARMWKDYDRTGRNRESKEFYNSDPWLKTRRVVLERYHGLDIYELKVNNRIVYADTVHHIEELRENPDRALDLTNLIPLSAGSHSFIHTVYQTKDKEFMQELLFKLINNQE